MKRHEIREMLGGPGSGFHGHAGRPGKKGGSAAGKGIREQLSGLTSTKDINTLKKQVIEKLDLVASDIRPDKYPDYDTYKQAIVDAIPEGYPRSEGELEEWVRDAKEKLVIVSSATSTSSRAKRVFTTVDSSGKRRARKLR